MAPVPATITVNFISNYAGNHRVCWRTGGSGPYDCSTIVSCTGGGSPCSATIAVTVDNETCDPVTFDGYVQATCEDVGSLAGRVPFTVTFTPNPVCDLYEVSCNAVSVSEIQVTAGGSGYSPLGGTIPVVITGGGGSSATATAYIGDGGIETSSQSSMTGGSGYLPLNSTVSSVPAVNIIGTGTGALFTVKIDNSGSIISAVLDTAPGSAGTGYAIGDTFEFPSLGGTGAVYQVDSITDGKIEYVTVTSGGSGYSSVPSADVPTGVTEASLLVILADCGNMNLGTDCASEVHASVPGIELNSSVFICTETAPTAGTGYVTVPTGCCYDCVQAVFSNDTADTLRLTYVDCVTREFIDTSILASEELTACIVAGSYYYNGPAPATTPGCD